MIESRWKVKKTGATPIAQLEEFELYSITTWGFDVYEELKGLMDEGLKCTIYGVTWRAHVPDTSVNLPGITSREKYRAITA